LGDLTVSKDIVVTTPAEIARRGNVIGSVLRAAHGEGRVCTTLNSACSRPNAGCASRLRTSRQPDGCWHSQQASERALKADLVLEGIDFPFTHDLNALRNKLPDSWPVRADLAELTGWAVQARYPGEWPEPSAADAVRAESEPAPCTTLMRSSSGVVVCMQV